MCKVDSHAPSALKDFEEKKQGGTAELIRPLHRHCAEGFFVPADDQRNKKTLREALEDSGTAVQDRGGKNEPGTCKNL